MLEKILDIIGKVLDKYFVPTIISLAVSIAIYSITQDDFWLFVKLGKELYTCLLTLIVLLVILAVKSIGRVVTKFLDSLAEQRSNENMEFA